MSFPPGNCPSHDHGPIFSSLKSDPFFTELLSSSTNKDVFWRDLWYMSKRKLSVGSKLISCFLKANPCHLRGKLYQKHIHFLFYRAPLYSQCQRDSPSRIISNCTKGRSNSCNPDVLYFSLQRYCTPTHMCACVTLSHMHPIASQL